MTSVSGQSKGRQVAHYLGVGRVVARIQHVLGPNCAEQPVAQRRLRVATGAGERRLTDIPNTSRSNRGPRLG